MATTAKLKRKSNPKMKPAKAARARRTPAKSIRKAAKKIKSSAKRSLKSSPQLAAAVQSKHAECRLEKHDMERLVHFEEGEPFGLLGPHQLPDGKTVVIRANLPRAADAWVKRTGDAASRVRMERIHPRGLFQAVFKDEKAIFPYRIGFAENTGWTTEAEDPYAFPLLLSDYDLHLLAEGTHWRSYEKLGAHVTEINGARGVHFAVWAPNARALSVIGNFNHWKPESHPMTKLGFSGFWALFIPGLKEGEIYKYAIKTPEHHILHKSDPYAFQTEFRPRTASVVAGLNQYSWHDREWMEKRAAVNPLEQAVSIYELHPGSWKRSEKNNWGFLNYRELAHEVVEYVRSMGYTHIELMPVMEHPLDESWGYQVISYFAPTRRYGTPEDFMYFVDLCHQNGIGVILDWVPGHFPKDAHGLAHFDGREIYAYSDPRRGEHKEWGTLVFDYGRNEVRNFLLSNALFWLDKYHIDGLRVDAVASMIYLDYARKDGEWTANIFGGRENLEAVSFLKKFNEEVHAQFPGTLTIAEESTSYTGVSRPTYTNGLGFSMKWNMGWMHDTFDYFSKDPLYRKYHQNILTFSMLYAFTENFVLPISHDEVVHGKCSLFEKMSGDEHEKFSNLRLFLGLMFAHPGKKLLFMGTDFAQRSEWNANQSIDWHLLHYEPHRQVHRLVRDLNMLVKEYGALHEIDFDPHGFEWIDFSDVESSVVSFIRRGRNPHEIILAVFNMTPVPRWGYNVGVPYAGYYREILNTDAWEYGGSGVGNFGGAYSKASAWQGRPHSLRLNLPPLGGLLFAFEEL